MYAFHNFCLLFKDYVRVVREDSRKLELLIYCVSGTAKNLVINLPLNDDNYVIAQANLEKMYHKPIAVESRIIDRVLFDNWDCSTEN